MNTMELKNLINERKTIIEMILNSVSGINEVSLSTVSTISLTDLRNNIDFEKYPELEYLFGEENLSYLRPYYGKLMWLEDNDLGIVSRELITAEIANILGLDLTGRCGSGICGLCDKKKIEIAKKQLDSVGVETKPITYLDEVIDIRLLYANNERTYAPYTQKEFEEVLYYDESNKCLVMVVNRHIENYSTSQLVYTQNVYDLLYSYSTVLGDDFVIDTNILDEEYYNRVGTITTITLKEAVKKTILGGIGCFKDGKFYFNGYNKKDFLCYNCDKENIEEFANFVSNLFEKTLNNENNLGKIAFLEGFAQEISEFCVDNEVPELKNFLDFVYKTKYPNSDLY